MKYRFFALLLTLTLVLSTFSGCGLLTLDAKLDAAEDAVEQRLDAAEDKAEAVLRQTPTSTPDKVESPKDTTALTAVNAREIALAHAGFADTEVNRLRAEYEIDDGVPQFDVQFHVDRWEYDYEIHAETGKILSYDKDH